MGYHIGAIASVSANTTSKARTHKKDDVGPLRVDDVFQFQDLTIQSVAKLTKNKQDINKMKDVQRDEHKMQHHTTSHDETSWITWSSSMFMPLHPSHKII
eukprot:scaffold87370_cov37-Cyclotella_meneghiniana.AAC.3